MPTREKNNKEEEEEDYKLQAWEIQQLLEDLEKHGGRKADNGKLIYDKSPTIYGKQGSNKRIAFRKCKNNFRRQSISTYWKEAIVDKQIQPHPLTLNEYQAYSNLLASKTAKSPIAPKQLYPKMEEAEPWEDEIHPDDKTGNEDGGVKFKKIDDIPSTAQPPPPSPSLPQFHSPALKQQTPRFSPLQQGSFSKNMQPKTPGSSFPVSTTEVDSFADAFSNMSLSEHIDLPYGDGSKERPIYVAVDWNHPEKNHGFCVHAFPNMFVDGRTRNIIEISHVASLCDLEGTIRCVV